MKNQFAIRRSFIVLAFIALGFSFPVFGDSADPLQQALDLVHQAESTTGTPPSDAQRIDWLTHALKLTQQAPNHRLKGHRVAAVQAMRSALIELQKGDPDHKAADYLRNADTELSAAVAINQQDAPATSAPPNAAPPPVASTPAPAATIPPEVTPAMEQAFVAKYKAALKAQSPDPMLALVAMDPAIDPKAAKEIKGWEMVGMVMTASIPNPKFSFVPATPEKEDKKDAPPVFDGKVYTMYLTPVVAIKVEAGGSVHDFGFSGSTIPLGIKDGQLMLIGMKEVPGAVPPPPPPALTKADNFGILPKLHKIDDKSDDPSIFNTQAEFLSNLQQPDLEVLASGENKYVYYAICRIKPNLLVYADSNRPGQGNYFYEIHYIDSHNQELTADSKRVRLIDDLFTDDPTPAKNVDGTEVRLPDNYSGPITVTAHYSEDMSKTSPAEKFSKTIDWK